ncbi:TetR/AcrR family transcriptional regulator [Actinopolymorpha alba]|uniref:TetR/AcrR family transcriptional regulator n=1 Tax=Actinopolymorpha alba TaxID=533267 RepID=UPI00037E25FC|nr:TetR family transcriptional regulator C-terminal domain-containing protein [Actinopolymorpha alba]
MGRRTDIADAAIRTLAAEGMRGLTHRAVDRTAGLPEGATAYYFRTRTALVQAVLDRLVSLDEQEVPDQDLDFDRFIDYLTATLNRWSTTDRRRQIARYELALEATRRSELREPLARATEQVHRLLATMLRGIAGSDAAELARCLTPLLDGLLFQQVTTEPATPISRDQIADLVRTQLTRVSGAKTRGKRKR